VAPTRVMIKVDIEYFECRAFLGSPEVLSKPEIASIVFEWKMDAHAEEICGQGAQLKMMRLFVENNFEPFYFDSKLSKFKRLHMDLSSQDGLKRARQHPLSSENLYWLRKGYVVEDVIKSLLTRPI